MIHFQDDRAKAAWDQAKEVAKEANLLTVQSRNGEFGLLDLYKYLDEYGCRDESGERLPETEHKMKVEVGAGGWDLGKLSFRLTWWRKVNGEWKCWMDGGAVYRAGEGWSVHT